MLSSSACVTTISTSLRNLSQCSSASAPVTISNSGLMAGRGSAPEQLYTVPEAVLFRNFELLGAQQQTRSLLLQNKTGKPVTASVSLPFTAHFRIAASGIATSDGAPAPQNHATPPHMVVVVQPGVPCKVVVEFKLPEDPNLNYVQDALIVCMGETVLWVPVKAVRQSLDPAGGAQLQAIINGLPFWPATEELQASAQQYMQRLNQRYGTQLQLPATSAPQAGSSPVGSAPSSGPNTRPPSQQAVAGKPAELAGASAAVAAGGLGNGTAAAAVPAAALSAAGQGAQPAPTRRTPSGSLPPETFSSTARVSTPDSLPASTPSEPPSTPPIIVSRPVVVQGRTAVAGPGAGAARVAVAATAATAATAGSGGRAGAGPSVSSAEAASGQPQSLRRASGGSGSGAAGPNAAFKMGLRYFDSRGSDVTAAVLVEPGAWTITDCDATAPSVRPGSSSRPPSTGEGASSSGVRAGMVGSTAGQHGAAGGYGGAGRAGPFVAPGMSSPAKPPLLTSLSNGRAGSFGRGLDSLGLGPGLGHSAVASPAGSGVGLAGGETDPLRQAALSAAMRELGLSNLPPPPRPGSAGPAAPPPPLPRPPVDMRLRPRSGGAGLAPLAAMSRSSASGSASILAGAAAAAVAGADDSDLELDFEARLQRNIDMSMRVGGPGGAPGSPALGRQLSAINPATPPMAGTRSVPLTPLAATVRRPSSAAGAGAGGGAGRPATADSQAGYGGDDEEEGLQAKLQQQIDSQLGSSGRSGSGAGRAAAAARQESGASGGGGGGLGRAAAGAFAAAGRSGAAGAAGPASGPGPGRRSSGSGTTSNPKAAAGSDAGVQRRASPATAPAPAQAAAGRGGAGKGPPPSKEQLRRMQDAWDAL